MNLRKGMWVMVDGVKVGVLTKFLEQPRVRGAEVHLVGMDGHTYTILPFVSAMRLRQAKYKDIPESRRPTPEIAARFGY